MGDGFFRNIINNPIIAAINDMNKAEAAINSPCKIIFLLAGDIFNIKSIVGRVKENNKLIYVHIDLMEGFSKDVTALRFINEHICPDGIITTRGNLIKAAKEMSIFTIQRLFVLDSLSLDTGIKSIKSTRPDAVEILPGIMPRVAKSIHSETRIPVITGGLISEKDDVIQNLRSGAIGISTSKEDIWYM
ncbi:glycerol-3-phosphate responsive antiterminator [Proteiniborus sp. MB09-C3]|uniref:glycerol-3-phosphate responsive antiterminator n=1 Tax=Proteiniborus sp. MB09-C3 TaxID=3050072 RepID=UPI002555B26A|nr:glycerol-3-phosphate responsive antiterminator [Proteiniborus sp. MB09-C3]WIV12674.1 glycerol-3-phosphate responsive antiterminator [Proteiniborus sp. MB09-C3]